jgi:signal transduction histidine kinase
VTTANLARKRRLDLHKNNGASPAAADGERLVDRERRSPENRKAVENLFHAANNALFVMEVNLELLTRYVRTECKHGEVEKWATILSHKIKEIKEVNRRLFATSADDPGYAIHSFISFRSVIQSTLEVYEDVARKKRIQISWTAPDFPIVAIWTDAVAIGTILDNLISNAIKFSPPQTTIAVTMGREEKDLICAVSDQGPGLSKEDAARIFQRGARLAPKPTGGESSIGYGLSIARDLVRKLGGRIWCDSVEGKGTCFSFSLPAESTA